jgi:hypothetical protein
MAGKRKTDIEIPCPKRRSSAYPNSILMPEATTPTPPHLAVKTNPGVQELYLAIVKMRNSLMFSKKSHESTPQEILPPI